MKATFHPAAEKDISEAALFYEKEASAALAARFVAEVKRVVRLLLEHPDIGTPRANGRQFFPLKVFPYGLIYRSTEDGIFVLVVRRHRQRPGYGASRRGV